jgi:ABC-type transport system involved in multi-copper enzyme maturation permease subunit
MSLWRSLFVENPMLIEVRRYRRRLFGGSKPSGSNVAVLTLFGVCYLGLLLIVGNGNGSIPPIAIVLLQTGLFTLAAPALLNNAIAGERDKRTWDLLMVAPVTKAQVMIGKMAGAMTNLLIGAALFLLPIFICAVSFTSTNYFNLAIAELNSLSFAILACAITLFFSARCKRPFTALGMSLGLLLLGTMIYPLLIGALGFEGGGSERIVYDMLMIFHPFVAQYSLTLGDTAEVGFTSPVLQIFVFVGLAAVILVWTERTLNYSDNEVRFLGRKRHA